MILGATLALNHALTAWGDEARQIGSSELGYGKMTDLQILARISPLPVAKRLPVGLGATEMTEFLWP